MRADLADLYRIYAPSPFLELGGGIKVGQQPLPTRLWSALRQANGVALIGSPSFREEGERIVYQARGMLRLPSYLLPIS